jgi:hypothetical protein
MPTRALHIVVGCSSCNRFKHVCRRSRRAKRRAQRVAYQSTTWTRVNVRSANRFNPNPYLLQHLSAMASSSTPSVSTRAHIRYPVTDSLQRPEERFADVLNKVARTQRLKAFGFPVSLPRTQKPEGVWGQIVDRREVPSYRLGWLMTKEELLDKHDSEELREMKGIQLNNMIEKGYFRKIWDVRVPENRYVV